MSRKFSDKYLTKHIKTKLKHPYIPTMENLTPFREFPFLTVYTFGDKFILIKFKNNGRIGVKEAKESIESFEELNKLGYNYVLTDATVKHFDISKDALDLAAKHPNGPKYNISHAILVNHSGIRLLAGFYLKFSKPTIPTMIFSSSNEAINWLKTSKVLKSKKV